MQLSIWEKESFFAPSDYLIIGSGLVGLWSAYWLKKKDTRSSVTVLERGLIPTGASTRNAGFACFGSITEILEDARVMGLDKTLEVLDMRYRGINRIRKVFGKKAIDLDYTGGYDLLTGIELERQPDLREQMHWLNSEIEKITGEKKVFSFADEKLEGFGLTGFSRMIMNRAEGYLHSGKLSQCLLSLVQGMGVTVLNGIDVEAMEPNADGYTLYAQDNISFEGSKVLVCTNGFVNKLLPELDVIPARGQVLLTTPIEDLSLYGTFHYDQGYYYFRNLGNRVLLGGARNKAFEEETTTEMETTNLVQGELESFLEEHILKGREYSIASRWSGIMAMGSEKMPLLKQLNTNLFCAVRMSGMGVALAPVAGEIMAKKMMK